MTLCLYLVRHGETAWSRSGRHTGRSDLPLTDRGEQEARRLEERLRGVVFSRVLTSPRLRAQRTCELAGLAPSAVIEPDLVEWDYGDCEGLTTAEIIRMRPGWEIYHDGCPGGETAAQVSDRADRLIARLRELEGNIALFAHGHFGRALGVRWIGLPLPAARHFLFGPASLSVLAREPGAAGRPVIARWNVPDFPRLLPGAPRVDAAVVGKRRAIERWENEGGGISGAGRKRTPPVRLPVSGYTP